MKTIILIISLFFVINQAQGKSPNIDETVSGGSFEKYQENNFKVVGFEKQKSKDKSLRNPSSNKEAQKKPVEKELAPKVWAYEE